MYLATAVPGWAHGLLVASGVVWVAAELGQAAKRRAGAKHADRGSRPIVGLGILVGALAAVAAERLAKGATIRPASLGVWAGVAIFWSGVVLRLWCFRTLGRYFTVTVQTSSDQPVIMKGPYRVLRHPSYAALLLVVMGVGLLIGNWLALAGLTAAVSCALVFRIHVEEDALVRELGDEYRKYAATHKRLVPFVW
jgi:protein-S-isoprenylcysteine O-methyltransferase Ste14